MIFGLFGSAQAGGRELAEDSSHGFRDYEEFIVEAELLGYHSAFLVEHHFTGWGQVSSTLNLLAWLAAHTSKLRLGTATIVLPWHNPVLLAEQVAMLKLLSGDRFDFGIGKGYRNAEFNGFNIPIEEAEARFEECLDVMLKAWGASERFSHNGNFWNFNDIIVEPWIEKRPAMWMGASSERSVKKVASRGFNLLLDQFADAKLTGQRVDIFKQAVTEERRAYCSDEVAVARELFIAEDERDKRAAIERLNRVRQRTIDHARSVAKSSGSHILSYANGNLPPTESALIGSVNEICEKLYELKEVGVEYVIFNVLGGSRDTLRQFASEIMPKFQTIASDLRSSQV